MHAAQDFYPQIKIQKEKYQKLLFNAEANWYSGYARLAPRSGEFNSVFHGHYILGIDKSVMQNVPDTCSTFIANPDCYDYTEINIFGIECKIIDEELTALKVFQGYIKKYIP